MSTFRASRHLAVALALAIGLGLSGPAAAVDTPQSANAPNLDAIRAKIKAKEFAAARDELLAIADKVQHADVYNLLGFAFRKLRVYDKAYTYYKKALDFEPEHKGALEYLGELYVETDQIAKAKENLAILVRLCPTGCEEREDLEKAIGEAEAKVPKAK
jgi:tetratricopeptide (TPR) repeat protein